MAATKFNSNGPKKTAQGKSRRNTKFKQPGPHGGNRGYKKKPRGQGK